MSGGNEMNMQKLFLLIPFVLIFSLKQVEAHCPLCVIGAGAAAGGAASLGVNQAVIGIFIGGFAISMGWWVANLIKKQFVPGQKWILIIASFLLTIIPIMPMMIDVQGIYISLMGGYGTLLNRTYVINEFLIGSLVGGFIVTFTPWLSNKITTMRKEKIIPYQGIILTFALLIIAGGIVQLMV